MKSIKNYFRTRRERKLRERLILSQFGQDDFPNPEGSRFEQIESAVKFIISGQTQSTSKHHHNSQ